LDQFGAEIAQQRVAIAAASQEQPIGRNGAQRSEEAQAVDKLADGIVDRHETLGVQLAERYMERPLSGRERAQTVEGEIDTLADADIGVADEQKSVAGDIVAAQELLLDEAILFRSQWTRKPSVGLRHVIGMEETDQGGKFVEPRQLLQQTPQSENVQGARTLDQGWFLRGEPGQPAQNVRLRPQLVKGPDAWMMLTQIAEKVLCRGPIVAFGGVTHGGGHRLNGGEEHLDQGMREWEAGAGSIHG
jgi:hypothetical protein